jgi:arylsulfatase A-like enzyme
MRASSRPELRRRHARSLAGGALLAALVAGCGPSGPLGKLPAGLERSELNVLLITLDTTRADHLSAYGYFRRTSPTLDRLARRSLTFDAAWAPMATTLPSHVSLMSGVWPLEHGVLGNIEHGGRRMRPSAAIVPVAELFDAAGWATGGFVSAPPLHQGTGIERGFDTFDQGEKLHRSARGTTDAATAWLRRHVREPFFLWVHYYDPHGPFTPPDSYRYRASPVLDRWLRERRIPPIAFRAGGAELDPVAAHNGYDGEIRYMDAQIHRLLDLLERRGAADRTVIVVVGDHGEGLGQHQVGGHGHVWREQLQVPLIVRIPWLAPRRIAAPASMVDVVPTVLGAMDVPGAEAWQARTSGRDLLREASGPALGLSSIRQTQLGTIPQRALTVGQWRWMEVGGADRLYQLDIDPNELVDLGGVLPVHRRVLARYADAVEAAQRARGEALGAAQAVSLTPEEIEQLRALGYVEP